mmetsp:Transcript_28620/g.53899  ORF Transcript_28620/g.53899 Transcript_28620/m.53899 type:complete len:242 (+) Transcript_28620:236-961(+)
MAPPRLWHQAHPAFRFRIAQHPPIGHRRLAVLMIDVLFGPVRPIHDQRQVDAPGLGRHPPPNPCHICLFRCTQLKLFRQKPLRMSRQTKHHHAGCVPIQPVHQQRMGPHRLHPRDQAVSQMRPLARHRQQPRWFVDHQHFSIVMQHRQRHIRRGIFRFHSAAFQMSAQAASVPSLGGAAHLADHRHRINHQSRPDHRKGDHTGLPKLLAKGENSHQKDHCRRNILEDRDRRQAQAFRPIRV